MNISSKLIEASVDAFAQLPGIGKRTALRLVVYLLKQPTSTIKDFTHAITKMSEEIKFCKTCHNISDHDICAICSNKTRDHSIICLVEDFKEIITIENTQQYHGLYHVLGGILSPMDGVGPDSINVETLIDRVRTGDVSEIIMALSPNIEGDTTIFYISKRLSEYDVKITTVARGIAFGGEIEYTDEITLARSILNRLPFEKYLVNQNDK